MKVLFVHQNFPGQFLHLAKHLGATAGNEVVFITQRKDNASLPGVKKIVYAPARTTTPGVHHYLQDTEAGILNAQNVARVALKLKESGFVPDVMLAHNGWGELWFLKDVFPDSPLIGYFEFFYRLRGADVGFEPGPPQIFDVGPKLRAKNIGNLLGLDAADQGLSPTRWQRSLYPKMFQPRIQVIHEGIDTDIVRPRADATFTLPGSIRQLTRADEVVTYVARNLEPYRGFPSFMRSLPAILQQRPRAQVLIVGGDDTSYGPKLKGGLSFRKLMLKELGDAVDLTRIHFLGKLPYSAFLQVLQVSRVHVYLTYPFVLSWSMLEAMSAECLVVASRTAPVQEVIRDCDNGLLVNIFDPKDISDHVVDALKNPAKYDRIRRRARESIEKAYDLKTVCLPAQLKMIEAACNRPTPRRSSASNSAKATS